MHHSLILFGLLKLAADAAISGQPEMRQEAEARAMCLQSAAIAAKAGQFTMSQIPGDRKELVADLLTVCLSCPRICFGCLECAVDHA